MVREVREDSNTDTLPSHCTLALVHTTAPKVGSVTEDN